MRQSAAGLEDDEQEEGECHDRRVECDIGLGGLEFVFGVQILVL